MESTPRERSTGRRVSRRRESSSSPERATRTRQRATRQSVVEEKNVPLEKSVEPTKPKTEKSEETKARKAPTPFSGVKLARVQKRKRMLIVLSTLVFGIGASAAVGLTDDGQINVQKTIEDRNERIRNNSFNESDVITSSVEVPVQNTSVNNKPDGGLVGKGVGSKKLTPEPEPEFASTTATSSLDVASSTDVVASSTEDSFRMEEEGDVETEEIEDVARLLDAPQQAPASSESAV